MNARALCLLLCASLAGGCSTTFTTLSLDRRVLRLQVTSETPGAVVLLDGKTVGQTPAEVKVPFMRKAEQIHSGKYKAGWAVLGAGLAMVASGVAMTAGGATLVRDAGPEDDSGKEAGGYVLAVFGVGLNLAGLASMGVGAVNVATSESSRERTVVEPPTAVVEVRAAGKKRSVRFSMSPAWPRPRLVEVGRIHVFDKRAAIRGCTVHVTAAEGETVALDGKGAAATTPPGQPLALPCEVRRLTPLVGHYDRKGKPLFTALYALRQGKRGGWLGALKVPVVVTAGGKQVRKTLILEARKAWDGPQMRAQVQPDVEITYER